MGGGGVNVTGSRGAAEILYHQEEKVLRGWGGGGNFGGPLGFPFMGHFPYKSDPGRRPAAAAPGSSWACSLPSHGHHHFLDSKDLEDMPSSNSLPFPNPGKSWGAEGRKEPGTRELLPDVGTQSLGVSCGLLGLAWPPLLGQMLTLTCCTSPNSSADP